MNKIKDNKPFYCEDDYSVGINLDIVTQIRTSTKTNAFNITVNFRTVRTDFIYSFLRKLLDEYF